MDNYSLFFAIREKKEIIKSTIATNADAISIIPRGSPFAKRLA